MTAFLTVATQWRVAPDFMSGRLITIGLDYAGAKVALDAAGFTITPALWQALAAMEAEAVSLLNQW